MGTGLERRRVRREVELEPLGGRVEEVEVATPGIPVFVQNLEDPLGDFSRGPRLGETRPGRGAHEDGKEQDGDSREGP
jgi:hypothetical protein